MDYERHVDIKFEGQPDQLGGAYTISFKESVFAVQSGSNGPVSIKKVYLSPQDFDDLVTSMLCVLTGQTQESQERIKKNIAELHENVERLKSLSSKDFYGSEKNNTNIFTRITKAVKNKLFF